MFGDLQRSRRIAYTAAFIGLITVGGWISVPFVPSPFTLQTFFVLLAGAVMKRDAIIPVVLYVFLGALGYLIGFIPAALVAGLAYESARPFYRICGLAAASLIILLCGVAWLIGSTGMAPAAAFILGMAIFLPGDAVKTGAAYMIARHLP